MLIVENMTTAEGVVISVFFICCAYVTGKFLDLFK